MPSSPVALPAAIARAVAQLGDPAILRVLGKSILLTLAIFAVAGAALYLALAQLFAGWLESYGGAAAGVATALALILGGWLLFRIVALAVIQFFADDIVRAVERRYYPEAARTARPLTFTQEVRSGAGGLARTLIANLIALPFALILLATGIGTVALFWAVNAWLIGRELRDLAWLPHRASAAMSNSGDTPAPVGPATRFALGGVVAALLAVPVLNLIAPVIGAASAAHLVHGARHAR